MSSALERMTADYARALSPLGYIGPLNFNCKKIGPDRFVPYELNGRFTGATAARALLGHPEVEYALDYFLDGRRPKPRRESRSDGGALRRIVQRLPSMHLCRPRKGLRFYAVTPFSSFAAILPPVLQQQLFNGHPLSGGRRFFPPKYLFDPLLIQQSYPAGPQPEVQCP